MSNSAPIALAVPAVGAVLGMLGPATSHPAPGVTGRDRPRDRVRPFGDPPILDLRAHAARAHTAPRTADPARRHAGPPRGRRRSGHDPGHRAASPRRGAEGVESPGAPWTFRGAVRATTGKVFFTIDGGDYVCSAGTVTGANHDLVVTAGHCAQDATGAWAHNWIYVPGYDQGSRPYGAFTARHVFVPDTWSRTRRRELRRRAGRAGQGGGRHVTDVVGAQGIAFDQPRGALVYGFGYPAGGRYDGERLTYCSGRTYPDTHRITHDEGLRCDMTEGSSGGPWLTRFDAGTGTGVVTSVSSFKYADDPATMYGPYFGAAVRRVYDTAQRS